MKSLRALLVMPLAACAGILFGATAPAGTVLQVANKTGHSVAVFLFADGNVHTNPSGGVKVQGAALANGFSTKATVTKYPCAIMLQDGQDIWHAEIQNDKTTVITFLVTTGQVHVL